MSQLDLQMLQRELDRTKTRVFMGKNAAFMGSMLCSLEFIWDESFPTAWISGTQVGWNPHFFLSLESEVRETVMMHEMWHPAQLYWVRMGDRKPQLWNIAADHRINNDLLNDGYSFKGIEWVCLDRKYTDPDQWPIEAIYDDLVRNPPPPPKGGAAGGDDVRPVTDHQKQQAVNAVVRAVTAAKQAGAPGDIPGGIEQVLTKFLAPVIPWEAALHRFFNDRFNVMDYSWKVRDRRFRDIYMPGRVPDGGKLEHLMYFPDVSGSVTDKQETRFVSELKYIKEQFNPEKLTIAQFDTKIQRVQVITEDEPFDRFEIIGRGGTSLECVRQMIQDEKPTAAVVFSDLFCKPMRPLTVKIPIIWVCIDNSSAKVPFGDQLIHIKE